jgi:hypothetical protein
MLGFEPGTYGLQRAGAELARGESSRIDEQAFVDEVSRTRAGSPSAIGPNCNVTC